jgi:hypothetical protein
MNVDGDKYMLTLTDKCFELICLDQEGAGKERNKSQNLGTRETQYSNYASVEHEYQLVIRK